MENNELTTVVNNVEKFKTDNIEIVKENIDNELSVYRKTLPKEFLTEDLEVKIQNEVDKKLTEFKKDIDLKPKALFYSLKSEVELNDNISKKELTLSAYSYLEKNTKSKFLKKILRELRKESK